MVDQLPAPKLHTVGFSQEHVYFYANLFEDFVITMLKLVFPTDVIVLTNDVVRLSLLALLVVP